MLDEGFESHSVFQYGFTNAQCRSTLWQDGLSMLATKPLRLQLESYLQGWTWQELMGGDNDSLNWWPGNQGTAYLKQ